MQKFKLEFDCENAAFDERNDNRAIAQVLRDVAKRIENGSHMRKVMDRNGNTIGAYVMPDDAE